MEEKNNYNIYIKFGIESPEYLGTILNVTERSLNNWLKEEQEDRFSSMQGLHGCPSFEDICDDLGLDYDQDNWDEDDFYNYNEAYCEAKEDNFPTYTTILTEKEIEEGIESETGSDLEYLK